MRDAHLHVQFAGPLVTIQDAGRPGHLRYGVAASGPMDRIAFAASNAALGNPPGATAIEISLGGLSLECRSGDVTVAVAGGDFGVEHAGAKMSGWSVFTLHQGETLNVRAGNSGSWTYLAFAGQLQADTWLGHTATHSTSGFGGGSLSAGQDLMVHMADVREDREGDIERPDLFAEREAFKVVLGPQDQWFQEEAIETFLGTEYHLTDSYDRMGVRLDGGKLPLKDALSIPSEPIIRGSVQVSGEGVPTILLADHQTTGGYPKIATMVSMDTDRLTQLRSRQSLRFRSVSASDALHEKRAFNQRLADYLARISVSHGTLLERLMRENLISGVVSD